MSLLSCYRDRPVRDAAGKRHHKRVMRGDCSANGRVRPQIWLMNGGKERMSAARRSGDQ